MRVSGEFDSMPKKEALLLGRELEKLQKNLGGIRHMSKRPDAVFILDTKKEHIAVTEANKLKIPVIAVVDTNVDPDVVQFPIPGNDDAIRANALMSRVIAEAIEEGRFIASKRNPQAAAAPQAHRRGRGRVRRLAGRRPPPGRRRPGRARRPRRLDQLAGRCDRRAGDRRLRRRQLPTAAETVETARRHCGRRPNADTETEPVTDPEHRDRRLIPKDGIHRERRTGPAPGHRRGHDGRQEGPRGQRRRHGSRQAMAAREGPGGQRQARRPREQPGPRRPGRSTATSARSSSSRARPTSSPAATSSRPRPTRWPSSSSPRARPPWPSAPRSSTTSRSR